MLVPYLSIVSSRVHRFFFHVRFVAHDLHSFVELIKYGSYRLLSPLAFGLLERGVPHVTAALEVSSDRTLLVQGQHLRNENARVSFATVPVCTSAVGRTTRS